MFFFSNLIKNSSYYSNFCQPKNEVADSAHNNETMFHTMNIAVYKAAEAQQNNKQNVYIQWHGMKQKR